MFPEEYDRKIKMRMILNKLPNSSNKFKKYVRNNRWVGKYVENEFKNFSSVKATPNLNRQEKFH